MFKRLIIAFLLTLAVFAASRTDYFGRTLGPDETLLVTVYDNVYKRYVFLPVPTFRNMMLNLPPMDGTVCGNAGKWELKNGLYVCIVDGKIDWTLVPMN